MVVELEMVAGSTSTSIGGETVATSCPISGVVGLVAGKVVVTMSVVVDICVVQVG